MNIFNLYLDKIINLIKKLNNDGLIELPVSLSGINVDIPPSSFNCDISTNVAMVLSKINKKKPIDIANQLVKVIKALVEVEVKKQQLNFLQNQFPKILEEAVQSRIKSKPQKKAAEVDPFTLAEAVLEQDRTDTAPNVSYTKNQALNKILNETAQSHTAVADDKTVSFGTHNVPTGQQPVGTDAVSNMRQSMAQQK